jgi:hypothetical protein
MRPDNSVVVGGADSWNALVWTDHVYAIWFPGEGSITPMLALSAGTWRADWIDILSGDSTSQTITAKSWVTTLTGVRRGGGAVLRITRQETSTGTSSGSK